MRRGGCSRRDPALELRYPDKTREEYLGTIGIKVIRFENDSIINDIDSVLNSIEDNLT